MQKITMLTKGIKEIAKNHGFNADVNYKENGEVCIYGGCNVPTLCDVNLLCEDLGISTQNVETSDFGIDVWIDEEWYETHAKETYVKAFGMEMWRRVA